MVLREIAWLSVVSIGTSGLALLTALSAPEKATLVLALGFTSVATALLSMRS